MMKMAAVLVAFCVLLVFVPTSVSAVQRLNSIQDLKRLDFGYSVPTNAVALLHWFANTVTIDNNDVITLTFDPDSGDYGSHHYGNFEQLLEPRPNNQYQYYTLGNIYRNSPRQLPAHITNPRSESAGGNRNRARIIVRVRVNDNTIDRVYMTQHPPSGSEYDPDHTYQLSPRLLRQIRRFPLQGNENSLIHLRDRFASDVEDDQLREIQQSWGRLSALGLLLVVLNVVSVAHWSYTMSTDNASILTNSTHDWSYTMSADNASILPNSTHEEECCRKRIWIPIVLVVLVLFIIAVVLISVLRK